MSENGSAIPLPPPPPTHAAPIQISTQTQRSSNQTPADSEPQYPAALASAFAQPSKDKRPFTYTPGGLDSEFLSEGRKTPSEIRRAAATTPTPTATPIVPRCLPINGFDSDTMPAIQHLQYNSPMSLYSKDSAQHAFHQQTTGVQPGFGTTPKRPEFDPAQSETLKAILAANDDDRMFSRQGQGHQGHGQGHQGQAQQHRAITPSQSARMDEPQQGQDYPHYHGFQNPKFQSPSFKRLQFLTGGDHEGAYHQQGSVRHHQQQQSHQQHQYQQQDVQQQQPIVLAAPEPQYQHQAREQSLPPVADLEPLSDGRPVDPHLAAKLAEAERPKVPQQQAPHWAHKAEAKHQKWTGAQGFDPREEQQQREFKTPEPQWGGRAHQQQDQWQRHYSQYNFESGLPAAERPASRARINVPIPREHGYEYGGTDFSMSPGRRARSQGPIDNPGYRAISRSKSPSRFGIPASEKEIMKPFVAPNVLAYGRGDQAIGSIYSNQHLQNENQMRGPIGPTGFGTYYGPTSGFKHGRRSQSTTRFERLGGGGPDFGVDYSRIQRGGAGQYQQHWLNESTASRLQAQQQYSPRAPTISPRLPRDKEMGTDFNRPHGYAASYTSSSHHQSHQSAISPAPQVQRPQPQPVEYNHAQQNIINHVKQSQHSSHTPATVGWRSGSTIAQDTTGNDMAITKWQTSQGPDWYARSGASTKASTSGEYLDADGNKVAYTKELVTSGEPGNERSLLTEQERKVMEEPLQPGVISRHVTTKYYKKSTVSNQSSTTAAVPTNQLRARTPLAIQPGEVQPGVSQF